jgi:AGCS family alanine or glycine:cation symporter
MYYLSRGLAEIGLRPLGKVLASLFAVCCILGAYGGANLFQANQSYGAVSKVLPMIPSWLYGIFLAVLVGIVIIGGIKRIGNVADKLVPAMVVIYVLASLWIILANLPQVPSAIATIFQSAFNPTAVKGGLIGVIVQGFRRSAFSNEAGIGSAAIAHSAAKTDVPIKEGLVALLEPFVDTVIICNMTALVIVITGVYDKVKFPQYAQFIEQSRGAELTSAAFGSVITWFPWVLAISVFLFAYSTMISWSYYGERAWDYLFGERSLIVYRVIFVSFCFIGSITSPTSVIDFTDATFFMMAFPNLLGCYLLSNKVDADLRDYENSLKLKKSSG